MDKEAFLGGESTSGGSRDRSSHFPRRSDAISHGSLTRRSLLLLIWLKMVLVFLSKFLISQAMKLQQSFTSYLFNLTYFGPLISLL
ncbi:hypothetical protein HYC85_002389 [Camellia sinensis]|uniref:Uncharacterized protein n=1 Tax=Camellia sinensis TaxID=4442 RepID=A0A7J7I830_CAMSI|nr:hypothetical protein HYC85_002389 [Camellia sinensis]